MKEIDGNIQKSVSVIKENPLLSSIEGLTGLLGEKADILMRTLEENASCHKGTATLLKRIDTNMRLSATGAGESLALLKKQDRNLQDGINILLSLEGRTKEEIDYLIRSRKQDSKNKFGLQFDYESEMSVYLDCSIDTLPIPTIGKRALVRHFNCVNYEDVLSVMLIHQRKGLLSHIHYLGRKSIGALEDYFVEIGLLEIRNKYFYISKLCFPANAT